MIWMARSILLPFLGPHFKKKRRRGWFDHLLHPEGGSPDHSYPLPFRSNSGGACKSPRAIFKAGAHSPPRRGNKFSEGPKLFSQRSPQEEFRSSPSPWGGGCYLDISQSYPTSASHVSIFFLPLTGCRLFLFLQKKFAFFDSDFPPSNLSSLNSPILRFTLLEGGAKITFLPRRGDRLGIPHFQDDVIPSHPGRGEGGGVALFTFPPTRFCMLFSSSTGR